MNDIVFARAIHVAAVVLWIGGLGFVTTVLLPAARRLMQESERVTFFEWIERRFAWQARVTTAVVGLSGLYMIGRLDLWSRFTLPAFWWMHAMVGIWLLFSLMLFVAEPLFLHRWFLARAEVAPGSTLHLIALLHWVLLCLSILTILGAVVGSHGGRLFALW